MRARLALVVVPLVVLTAACGGGSPTAEWKTGKDVLDGVKAAGFTCDYTGSGEQVETGAGMLGADSEVAAVDCTDFGVVLLTSRAEFLDDIAAASECEAPEADAMDFGMTTVVLGDNFMVIAADEWPGAAQPADFTRAFGGEETTLIDLLKEACPDTEFPDAPSASASGGTADTAPLDSALREVAKAMEIAYTTSDAYPTTLTGLDYEPPAAGITVELTRVDDAGYCLTATSPAATRYYDSMAGGLTDQPCAG